MKAVLCFLAVLAIGGSSALQTCQVTPASVPTAWITMQDPCVTSMREQIQKEIGASMTYLAMGAYFSRDVVNRPGFAHLFFESASEEREHGIKLIEYLSMRGNLSSLTNVTTLLTVPIVENQEWANGVSALRDALNLESEVTKSIRNVIKVCEEVKTFNDYHLVDYLTGDFLEEQYKGQRVLAGRVSTLDKMMVSHGVLGEFLFDKKLLAGEV